MPRGLSIGQPFFKDTAFSDGTAIAASSFTEKFHTPWRTCLSLA
jgi:hypothetical protein